MHLSLELAGETFDVELQPAKDGGWTVTVDGESYAMDVAPNSHGMAVTTPAGTVHVAMTDDQHLLVDGRTVPFGVLALGAEAGKGGRGAADGAVRAPMNGKLESVAVAVGDTVAEGDVLFVLEAMKMRNQVKAPRAGVVASLHGAVGDALSSGDAVVTLETE